MIWQYWGKARSSYVFKPYADFIVLPHTVCRANGRSLRLAISYGELS
jgi:hypothetical protein